MRAPSSRPPSRDPFAHWPKGLSFGDARGSAWFLPEGVLCIQIHASRVDVSLAEAYMRAIRSIRDAERDVIVGAGGLRIYQDFRSLRLIDRDARAFLADAARSDFGRWSIVSNKIELSTRNPIVRTAIHLIARIAAQMGLPPFQFPDDLAKELERDGVRAPLADASHDARHASYSP